MSLEEEIAGWASTRPEWQQQVLAELAAGKILTAAECKALAAELTTGKSLASSSPPSLSELAALSVASARVQLNSIEVVAHVNRLQPSTLTFASQGLTVIYGDNASGKSGYARLIKNLAHARDQEPILSDIFSDSGTAKPAARISFTVDAVASVVNWPQDQPGDLGRIHFYDRACGDAYISTESEITYRPSVLALFDYLVGVCDRVRRCLDDLLGANALQTRNLPKVGDPSLAAFVDGLSAMTTDDEINFACAMTAEPDKQIAALREEEGHLLDSDPAVERNRLSGLAERLDAVARHLTTLEAALGPAAEATLRTQLAKATDARKVAQVAASRSFADDALPGTGSPLWHAMWEAARQFSIAESYPGETFPVVRGSARCPLCQQEVGHEGAHRLERFAEILADTTQSEAQRTEEQLARSRTGVGAVSTLPPEISAHVALIERDEPTLAASARAAVADFAKRQEALRVLTEDSPAIAPAPSTLDLSTRSAALRSQALSVDASAFQRRLTEVRKERTQLESRLALSGARADIKAEVERRRARAALDAAKRQVDTTGITRKSTELARTHVTTVITDRFTRESDQLRLQRITLQDTGGHKGQLHQKPAFLAAKQRADMQRVLSEGEQTALGLAGFFTEAELDEGKSALVFDDPVSSLSHIRRGHVADRLASFARDRQVVVFTHELEFAGELAIAADRESVTLTERQVMRNASGEPGICLDEHPWKAKSAKGRLAALGVDLQRLKRDAATLVPQDYETRLADWAGRLSETWERIVKEEISDQLFEPSRFEVRPKMMKVLAKLSAKDVKEFDESYAKISRWARRHDKARGLNYVVPDMSELEAELKLVRDWFTQLRKYRD